jgi:hypothetical protein
MQFVKRGGRKQIFVPDGAQRQPTSHHARIDSTLIKAPARAFRWRKLLEIGKYASIQELAVGEAINPSYVSRILRLTLLAPPIVEAVLEGHGVGGLTLAHIMRPFSVDWGVQRHVFAADY